MVDISIVDGGYKLTYNWGVPHCNINNLIECFSRQSQSLNTKYIKIHPRKDPKINRSDNRKLFVFN